MIQTCDRASLVVGNLLDKVGMCIEKSLQTSYSSALQAGLPVNYGFVLNEVSNRESWAWSSISWPEKPKSPIYSIVKKHMYLAWGTWKPYFLKNKFHSLFHFWFVILRSIKSCRILLYGSCRFITTNMARDQPFCYKLLKGRTWKLLVKLML